MGELDVGAADDLDSLDDGIGVLLQLLLQRGRDGQHGSGAEAVARVDSHGVDVLDETHGDHLVLGVADHFELQLLPAQHRFLHQHLAHQARSDAPLHDHLQLFPVVDEAAAGPAHGVRGADDHRIAEPCCDRDCFIHRVADLAAGHVDAEAGHGLFEGQAILSPLDGVWAHADDRDSVPVEHARAVELRGQVQAGLAPQVGQQRIGSGRGDDLGQGFEVERLDVGLVCHHRVGHDGGRVGVHQHDLVAQMPERFARLRPGIVELAGLTDHDRA